MINSSLEHEAPDPSSDLVTHGSPPKTRLTSILLMGCSLGHPPTKGPIAFRTALRTDVLPSTGGTTGPKDLRKRAVLLGDVGRLILMTGPTPGGEGGGTTRGAERADAVFRGFSVVFLW